MNTTPTPDEVQQLATEHAALADTIATATARQKEIKTQLADLGEGKYTAGPYTVQVTVPHRFDAKAAEACYPADKHPEFWTPTLDRKKLEHALPPASFEVFKVGGTPTVNVK